jgi:hypothetical protein
MLHRAAAANAKMPADRLDPLRTRLLHSDKPPAVWVAWRGVDFDDFARQRSRDENRSVGALGYSVAMLAKAFDQKSLSHAAPR